MPVRRAGPRLMCTPLTDPGLRAAENAHVTVNQAAGRLLQSDASLLRAEGRQHGHIYWIRQHHVTIQKERPGFLWIPAIAFYPILATDEGLCATGSEVLKSICAYRSRYIIRLEPGKRLSRRVIRRSGIADNNRVHLALHGIHETLNNAGLIFYHAQKD